MTQAPAQRENHQTRSLEANVKPDTGCVRRRNRANTFIISHPVLISMSDPGVNGSSVGSEGPNGLTQEAAQQFPGYQTILSWITNNGQFPDDIYVWLKIFDQEGRRKAIAEDGGDDQSHLNVVITKQELENRLIDRYGSDSSDSGLPKPKTKDSQNAYNRIVKDLLRLGVIDYIPSKSNSRLLRVDQDLLYWLLTNLHLGRDKTGNNASDKPIEGEEGISLGFPVTPSDRRTRLAIARLARSPQGDRTRLVTNRRDDLRVNPGSLKLPSTGENKQLPIVARHAQLYGHFGKGLSQSEYDISINSVEVGAISQERVPEINSGNHTRDRFDPYEVDRGIGEDELRDEYEYRRWFADVSTQLGYRSTKLLEFIIDYIGVWEKLVNCQDERTVESLLTSLWNGDASSFPPEDETRPEGVGIPEQQLQREFNDIVGQGNNNDNDGGDDDYNHGGDESVIPDYADARDIVREFEYGWAAEAILNLNVTDALEISKKYSSVKEFRADIIDDPHRVEEQLERTVAKQTAKQIVYYFRQQNPLTDIEPQDHVISTEIKVTPRNPTDPLTQVTERQDISANIKGSGKVDPPVQQNIKNIHNKYRQSLSDQRVLKPVDDGLWRSEGVDRTTASGPPDTGWELAPRPRFKTVTGVNDDGSTVRGLTLVQPAGDTAHETIEEVLNAGYEPQQLYSIVEAIDNGRDAHNEDTESVSQPIINKQELPIREFFEKSYEIINSKANDLTAEEILSGIENLSESGDPSTLESMVDREDINLHKMAQSLLDAGHTPVELKLVVTAIEDSRQEDTDNESKSKSSDRRGTPPIWDFFQQCYNQIVNGYVSSNKIKGAITELSEEEDSR